MDAWPACDVPAAARARRALRLYDTAAGAVAPTPPGATARMYVCGITPYDATHLGHAATYLAFDLVQRVWRDAGHDVHYVQNVTDVDDPLLERAAHTGEDWVELAAREIDLFRDDMTALRVLPPDDYVGAVEAVPEITVAIETLLDSGAAYRVDDGHLLRRRAAPAASATSPATTATPCCGCSASAAATRTTPASTTRSTRCCGAAHRWGEPFWDTPLGTGRPGWHIECTVIALQPARDGLRRAGRRVGPRLPAPRALGRARRGARRRASVRAHYVHAGMIGLDGEKMSKSRGNLVLVSKLRAAGVDPMAIRLALLDGHYRADREWTGGRLPAAEARLARWRAAVARAAGPPADAVLAEVRERLADDLDTVAAIAAVDAWVEAADGAGDERAPGLLRDAVDALLGIAL